jgi:hypothetical protein
MSDTVLERRQLKIKTGVVKRCGVSLSRTFFQLNGGERLKKEYKLYLDEVNKNTKRRGDLIAEGAEEWYVKNAVRLSINQRAHHTKLIGYSHFLQYNSGQTD